MTDMTMPRLSDSMEEGTILTWLINGGQPVAGGRSASVIRGGSARRAFGGGPDFRG